MSNLEEARSLYQQALERYGEIRVMLSHAQQELDYRRLEYDRAYLVRDRETKN